MTEQEQKDHAQMVARKAAAFDWLTANKCDLFICGTGWVVAEARGLEIASGPTPLEAVEAAMESEARK